MNPFRPPAQILRAAGFVDVLLAPAVFDAPADFRVLVFVPLVFALLGFELPAFELPVVEPLRVAVPAADPAAGRPDALPVEPNESEATGGTVLSGGVGGDCAGADAAKAADAMRMRALDGCTTLTPS